MSGFQRYFWRSIQPRSCASSDQSPARSATQPAAPVAFSRRASAFSFARWAWRRAWAVPPLPLDAAMRVVLPGEREVERAIHVGPLVDDPDPRVEVGPLLEHG